MLDKKPTNFRGVREPDAAGNPQKLVASYSTVYPEKDVPARSCVVVIVLQQFNIQAFSVRSNSTFARPFRLVVWTVIASLVLPLMVACGGSRTANVPPPVDDTARVGYGTNAGRTEPPRTGLSTGTKVVLLAGAAALYYLYKQHQNSQAQGPNGQYYLSKNGRVYYRDAEHRAHYVTPPQNGIQVPTDEAQNYRSLQGYNGSTTGQTLDQYANAQSRL